MGTSHGDFTKYPRTPHLFGSKGTDDDKHLNEADSKRFVSDEFLIVEEKLDGTNVGIHFRMVEGSAAGGAEPVGRKCEYLGVAWTTAKG